MHVHLPAYVLICGPNSLRFCASVVEPSSPVTAAPRRAALAFILITVTLDMLALGVIVPVLPRLVVDFVGGDTARGAEIYGLFGTVWALMQFFFRRSGLDLRPLRTPAGDRLNLGLGLDYIFMALAPRFHGHSSAASSPASHRPASARLCLHRRRRRRARARFGMVGAPSASASSSGRRSAASSAAIRGCRSVAAGEPGQCMLRLAGAAGVAATRTAHGVLWRRANPLELAGAAALPSGLFDSPSSIFSQLARRCPAFVLYADYRYGWDARRP
jgi:DHA1 family tetracycline resistance protein-like MFS transporter